MKKYINTTFTKLATLLILLVSSNQAIAQDITFGRATEISDGVNQIKRNSKDSNAEGSPYLKEKKSIGTFYLNNKQVAKKLTRIDYLLSGFEFESNDKTYLADASVIDSVVLDSTTYVFRTFNYNSKNTPRVIKIIEKSPKGLLGLYQWVEFSPEVKAGSYIDPKPARYEFQPAVYLFDINGKIILLNNFKNLYAAFPDKEKEIKQFIKEKHINANRQDELRILLAYISRI